MALPWLRILDAVIGVTDLARSRKIRSLASSGEPSAALDAARAGGGLEARLAGVVVAALKEAFDRDTRRLELEREQREAEQLRAERALQLEMLRQNADREINRLRAVAAVAIVAWLGSLFFAGRMLGAAVGARVTLGFGWLLLLAAIAAAFSGQSAVARSMPTDADRIRSDSASSGAGGVLALWLMMGGLVLVAISALV
jgi:hypothetical protein